MREGLIRYLGGVKDGVIEKRRNVGYSTIHVPIPRRFGIANFEDIDKAYSANFEYQVYYYNYIDSKGRYVYSIWKTPPKILALEIVISDSWARFCSSFEFLKLVLDIQQYADRNELNVETYKSCEHLGHVYCLTPKDSKVRIKRV